MVTTESRARRSGRAVLAALAVLALLAAGTVAQAQGGAPRPPGAPKAPSLPRTVPPTVQITSPPPDATFNEDTVRLTGAATSPAGVADVTVTVNGRSIPVRDFEAGFRHVTIDAVVDLTVGENLIQVFVRDRAGGQVSTQRRVRRSAATAAAAERWALVIGARKYDHAGIPSRRFAEQDASAVSEVLVRRGGFKASNLRLVHDTGAERPTLANIVSGAEWLYQKAGPRDTVVIYFAGRGAKDDDRAYLLARDTDPSVPETSALDLERFESLVRRLRARQVLVLLDATFAPLGSVAGETIEHQFLSAIAQGAGRVVLVASAPGEDAVELAALKHGLFTYYLVRALDGGADADQDGAVTGAELFEHLQRVVSDHADMLGVRQRPVMHGPSADVPALSDARAGR